LLSPVHTSDNVEATFDFVEATFDFVAKTATMSNKILSFRQSRNKLNMFNFVSTLIEISFDIVAETGNIVAKNDNNVEATFDFVE